MGDIITTDMDVDVDYSTSEPSAAAESGDSDTMDMVNIVNRPLRENLSTLITPAFANDYTEAQFVEIPQIMTSNMDVEANLPAGASGAWGALQKYDGSMLNATIQWSFDQFASALKSESVTNVEYISGSGIPGYVTKGDNDPGAGGTGRDKQDYKIIPVIGRSQEDLNLDDMTYWKAGPPYYGWNEINYQFGRLTVTVYDCFGNLAPGEGVYIVQTDEMLLTNDVGQLTYNCYAQTLDVKSLRGSKTKTAKITALNETTLNFSYAGFNMTVINGGDIPVINTPVLVEEVDDTEQLERYTSGEGKCEFPNLKINTKYKITVLNYYREQISGGEGLPIYITFSPYNITDWNSPAGYPSTIGNVVIYVYDSLTQRTVDGLKMKAYDATLSFCAETESGRGAFVLPASDASPLTFTLEIIGAADRRYVPFKDEITLTEDETRTLTKYLTRRAAAGGSY